MKFDITAKATGKTSGEIMIYGYISDTKWDDEDVTAKDFDNALKELGSVKDLLVRVNSYGGSVFAGLAIVSMIDTAKKSGMNVTARIEGIGASMGSVIPQAAGKVVMANNSMMMIHKPSTIAWGNADALLDTAEMLDKAESQLIALYKRRFTGTDDELKELIRGKVDGTWLTADEALAWGLCDEVDEPVEMAACAGGYRMNGIVVPTAALKGAAEKIQIHETDGGEKMIYNKETDAKIKALLDEGKVIALSKAGEIIIAPDNSAQMEDNSFLTAEQVQEQTGVENANPDTILGMLGLLANSGVTPANADDTLCKLLEKAEKATTLTAKAAERDVWFETLVDEALENGVRAEGNDFDKDWWTTVFKGDEEHKSQPMAKVKAQSDKWLAKAEQEFSAGGGRRSKVPGTANATQAPDDCFTL